jgi:hypothetical protein
VPIAKDRATILAPDGSIANLPFEPVDPIDAAYWFEYLDALERLKVRPEWRCHDCGTGPNPLEVNRDLRDRIIEVMFTCQCRTLYAKRQ